MTDQWKAACAIDLHDINMRLIGSRKRADGTYEIMADGVFTDIGGHPFLNISGYEINRLLDYLGIETVTRQVERTNAKGETKTRHERIGADEFIAIKPMTTYLGDVRCHLIDLQASIDGPQTISIRFTVVNDAQEEWIEESTYCGGYSIRWYVAPSQ